ncbi:MAG: helix-turn-helix transcriptional regulator [Alphaproteobacteria bacterium]|nr:helix-turn-helix transcriptional regulator [Alphaproteobacteria bacterium]
MSKDYAGDFCPVAKASEVFAQRWTPLVMRELLTGARRFNDLRNGVPLMSRALLAQRLKELEHAGIIETVPCAGRAGHEYRLTVAGLGFRPVIEALSLWGQVWGQGRVGPDDLNTTQLVWGMRHHAHRTDFPDRRLVVRFEFRGVRRTEMSRRVWWLVITRADMEVCVKYPGFAEDVLVRADLGAFTRVWLGYRGLRDALAEGSIEIEGKRSDVVAFERCVGLFAEPTVKKLRFEPVAV